MQKELSQRQTDYQRSSYILLSIQQKIQILRLYLLCSITQYQTELQQLNKQLPIELLREI